MASVQDDAVYTTEEKEKKAMSKKESEELEEVLDSVINKRVTIPKKCMELHRKAVGYELARLEDATVKLEENKEKEKFQKLLHRLRKVKKVNFYMDDLHEAGNQLRKTFKRTKEINKYLIKRRQRCHDQEKS